MQKRETKLEKHEQQLTRILEPDAKMADDSTRVDKAVARAGAQVAAIDVSSLFVARMWVALAGLLGPVFACICRKIHQSDADIRHQEDKDHGSN